LNLIERSFLRAKHWQIFLLVVGVSIVGEMVVMRSLPQGTPTPQDLQRTLAGTVGVTAIFMLCLLGWIWSMGSYLTSIAPRSLQLPMGLFRLAVIYPSAYLVALFVTLCLVPAVPAAIAPFHLLATVCMFYDLYFVSKTLVMAETGRPASFYGFSGPFFLLWFVPIGVWVIQPRINRLFTKRRSDAESPGGTHSGGT